MTPEEEYIIQHISVRTLLEQLAEESAELSQAALKLIRARGDSENATPVDEKAAMKAVLEEAKDVLCTLWLCGIHNKELAFMSGYWKIKRWARRLGYKED